MLKLILAIYVIATTLGLVMLKLSANMSGPLVSYANGKINFNLHTFSVIGLVSYATSFLLFTYLVSKYELGYIIPLTASFVYIIVFVASYFIFKESFTTTKIIGIAMILFGLFFLNVGK